MHRCLAERLLEHFGGGETADQYRAAMIAAAARVQS